MSPVIMGALLMGPAMTRLHTDAAAYHKVMRLSVRMSMMMKPPIMLLLRVTSNNDKTNVDGLVDILTITT